MKYIRILVSKSNDKITLERQSCKWEVWDNIKMAFMNIGCEDGNEFICHDRFLQVTTLSNGFNNLLTAYGRVCIRVFHILKSPSISPTKNPVRAKHKVQDYLLCVYRPLLW
jgi:hypothetical protein